MEFEIGWTKKQRGVMILCLRMRVTIEPSVDAVQLLRVFNTTLGIDFRENVKFNSLCAICGRA